MTSALRAPTPRRPRTPGTVPTAARQHHPVPAPDRPTASTGRAGTAERPLPEAVRARMEAAFGADFSRVTVREDTAVAELDAMAFTRDETIAVRPGRSHPSDLASPEGLEVLAHELTHVLQQRAGRVPGAGMVEHRGLEAEADEAGRRAPHGEPVPGQAGPAGGEVTPAGHRGSAPPQSGVAQPMVSPTKQSKKEKKAAAAAELEAKKQRRMTRVAGRFDQLTDQQKQDFAAQLEAERQEKYKGGLLG
jgi:hypothetical protein